MCKSRHNQRQPQQSSGEFNHMLELTDEELNELPLDLPTMMVELAIAMVAFLVVRKFDDGMRTAFLRPEAVPWMHQLLEYSIIDKNGIKDEWSYAAVYDILSVIATIQNGVDESVFPIIACDNHNLPDDDELKTWEAYDPRHVEYINVAFKEGQINAGSSDYEVIIRAYFCWKSAISLKVIVALRSLAQVHIDHLNRLKAERGITQTTQ